MAADRSTYMPASLGCAAIILISAGCVVAYRRTEVHHTVFLPSKPSPIPKDFPMSRF
jgi:hypothetical protein